MTREERLRSELTKATTDLDNLGRTLEPGMMRTQQRVAGQRCRVFGLRVELEEIAYQKLKGGTETALAKRQEHRANRDSLLIRIKEQQLSARAASKQATEDELPAVIAQLNAQTDVGAKFAELH